MGITRNIGKGGKIIIPTEIVEKFDLKAGDYIEWDVGEKIVITFGEMLKKEKGRD